MYEGAKIVTEQDFKEAMKYVLFGCLEVGYDKIQLVTISRPSAYGKYEPYHFVDSEREFAEAVVQM